VRTEIRAGKAHRERKLAICSGSLPLSPEDRAELLAVLAEDSDGDIADQAAHKLLTIAHQAFVAALARPDADLRLFTYCATEIASKPSIADALAKNRACPRDLVARAAGHLSSAGIQSLLDDLDGLSMSTALAEALAGSIHATPEQMELIAELSKGVPEENHVREAVAAAEPHPVRRQSLIQKISNMTVVERIQLAIKGPREARTALIRDSNKIIQRAVLQSPRLTETDVESFASMTNLSADILRIISANRGFMKNDIIVKNLVNNPKMPLDVSLRLLMRLTPTDLKHLTVNKNIPETLRSMSVKLFRQRQQSQSDED
jgi:hypothetical protein